MEHKPFYFPSCLSGLRKETKLAAEVDGLFGDWLDLDRRQDLQRLNKLFPPPMAPTPSDILEKIVSALASHDPDGDSGDLVEEIHCILEQYHPEPMSSPTPEQINNLVTFTKKPDGEWAVRDVHGPVRGDVYSHIEGSVYADIRGDVHGSVEGTVSGPVRGNVVGGVGGTIGGRKRQSVSSGEEFPNPEQIRKLVTFKQTTCGEWHVGDVLGDIHGNVHSSILGGVQGYIRDNISNCVGGSVLGSVLGEVKCNVGGGVGGTIAGRQWSFVRTPKECLIAAIEAGDTSQALALVDQVVCDE